MQGGLSLTLQLLALVLPKAGAAEARPDVYIDETADAELMSMGIPALVYRGILTEEQCKEFIDLAETQTWDTNPDSIDYFKMYQIDLYNKGEVLNKPLFDLLEPHIERITEWMKARWPNSKNSMDWVFMRKYSEHNDRQGLKAHCDTNEHSLNVMLNSDVEGGNLFMIRQDSEIGKIGLKEQLDSKHKAVQYKNVPGGETNTSTYFFPYMAAGYAYSHDNTIWHGITQVRKGTKYSLLFFYDEPELSQDVKGIFINEIDKVVDIFWVGFGNDDETKKLVHIETLEPGETHEENTVRGHKFIVKAKDSGKIVTKCHISEDNYNMCHIRAKADSNGPKEVGKESPADAERDSSSSSPQIEEPQTVMAEEDIQASQYPEPILVWGYDVRGYLEDEEGRPRMDVIGTVAAVSVVISVFAVVVILPQLEKDAKLMQEQQVKKTN